MFVTPPPEPFTSFHAMNIELQLFRDIEPQSGKVRLRGQTPDDIVPVRKLQERDQVGTYRGYWESDHSFVFERIPDTKAVADEVQTKIPDAPDEVLARVKAMSDADLETTAVELGVTFGKKASRDTRNAKLADAIRKQEAEAKAANGDGNGEQEAGE